MADSTDKKAGPQITWGGRFSEPTDAFVARLNASVGFDQRLYAQDIAGSQAHARMLAAQGVISAEDAAAITAGLEAVKADIDAGDFDWSVALEDVHMNVEHRLTARIGAAGGRLHTARSRNDQVATDLRLWVLDFIDAQVLPRLDALQGVLIQAAEEHGQAILPGYTHLQRAQPVLLAHHLLAYVEMLDRDRGRFADCRRRAAESPLGCAALAGTPFPIDRAATAKALGFDRPAANSLDAVGDRDFAVEFASAASLCMVHLSRLSEELVVWSSQEFGFIELGDAFATGSSIMPQKKNPDIPELVRGKTGRVFGDLVALLTVLKGLPLAYNKDLQEDKEALFDAADTVRDSLEAMIRLLPATTWRADRMRAACDAGFVTATDVADYLANKGVPFREAHHVVGRLVGWCIAEQRPLTALTLAEFQRFHSAFAEDILRAVTVEASVAARTSQGGTAPLRVAEALAAAKARLAARHG
ncbi:MAG: argininosuccinate lyase [Myxococcales bacterium]|nr:argininosuccinate lyase [Myxococcales bacterium]